MRWQIATSPPRGVLVVKNSRYRIAVAAWEGIYPSLEKNMLDAIGVEQWEEGAVFLLPKQMLEQLLQQSQLLTGWHVNDRPLWPVAIALPRVARWDGRKPVFMTREAFTPKPLTSEQQQLLEEFAPDNPGQSESPDAATLTQEYLEEIE